MRRLDQPQKKKERGVALLVVLSTLALITSVIADFQYNSRVDLELALRGRDELQAEYNALSALRLRALLLKNARVVNQALSGLASAMGVDPTMMPSASQLLEMVPVECSLMSSIVAMGQSDGDEGADGEPFFPGSCSATSKSEHAKISIAALRNPTGAAGKRVIDFLMGFLSDPKLEYHFQTDDAAGSHAERPAELVGAMVDWVDDNNTGFENQAADEDRHYDLLRRDAYKAKNAPMDSVAELQMVHGVNDSLYNILKDRVSIYNSAAEVELGTADDVSIALGLCSISTLGCDWLLQPAFWTALSQLRSLGGSGFAPMNMATLTALIATAGIPVDTGRLSSVFSDRTSTTWYTIEASGEVEGAKKRIRAVFQAQEAQFYYYRVE